MNEIRYYLKQLLTVMQSEASTVDEDCVDGCDRHEPFVPKYIVTAVKLPTGAIELAVNTEGIKEKIEYILEAYDETMHLKTNKAIHMQNVMVV